MGTPKYLHYWFDRLQREGNTIANAVALIRQGLVPDGYKAHPWRENCRETLSGNNIGHAPDRCGDVSLQGNSFQSQTTGCGLYKALLCSRSGPHHQEDTSEKGRPQPPVEADRPASACTRWGRDIAWIRRFLISSYNEQNQTKEIRNINGASHFKNGL